MILDEILQNKKLEIVERQKLTPLDQVKQAASQAPPPRPMNFGNRMGLIAEVKRKSPSQGDFVASVDPVSRAQAYEKGGASAISVLTDERYFGGSLADLTEVRAGVSVPVLLKDFVVDPYQVYEARAAGADIVLLIVAAIDDESLLLLRDVCLQLGMATLIEVHDQHELARAIASGATLIGINNRDLTDLSVDLVTTEYLAPFVPDDAVLVSESGIASREDVLRVQKAGAKAVLVGEALMRSPDPRSAITELMP